VPGIGLKSTNKIIQARKYRKLNWQHLQKIGIAINRAKYFITCDSREKELKDLTSEQLKQVIIKNSQSKFRKELSPQLSLF
ncbi:MAG TPA: hypothetical protein VJ973_05080, partial [Christiangramia sp.]|nr:hypothetical protein [Christiangramia sp.]